MLNFWNLPLAESSSRTRKTSEAHCWESKSFKAWFWTMTSGLATSSCLFLRTRFASPTSSCNCAKFAYKERVIDPAVEWLQLFLTIWILRLPILIHIQKFDFFLRLQNERCLPWHSQSSFSSSMIWSILPFTEYLRKFNSLKEKALSDTPHIQVQVWGAVICIRSQWISACQTLGKQFLCLWREYWWPLRNLAKSLSRYKPIHMHWVTLRRTSMSGCTVFSTICPCWGQRILSIQQVSGTTGSSSKPNQHRHNIQDPRGASSSHKSPPPFRGRVPVGMIWIHRLEQSRPSISSQSLLQSAKGCHPTCSNRWTHKLCLHPRLAYLIRPREQSFLRRWVNNHITVIAYGRLLPISATISMKGAGDWVAVGVARIQEPSSCLWIKLNNSVVKIPGMTKEAGKPLCRIYRSISAFPSKWLTWTRRPLDALVTSIKDEKIRCCIPSALQASAIVLPWTISGLADWCSQKLVTRNTVSDPCTTLFRSSEDDISPYEQHESVPRTILFLVQTSTEHTWTTSTPWAVRAFADSFLTSRVTALMRNSLDRPESSRIVRITEPPWFPVAPKTVINLDMIKDARRLSDNRSEWFYLLAVNTPRGATLYLKLWYTTHRSPASPSSSFVWAGQDWGRLLIAPTRSGSGNWTTERPNDRAHFTGPEQTPLSTSRRRKASILNEWLTGIPSHRLRSHILVFVIKHWAETPGG